jgi:hypothetical protein
VLHFNPKNAQSFQLPPVNSSGFWSVTIYSADGTLVHGSHYRLGGLMAGYDILAHGINSRRLG